MTSHAALQPASAPPRRRLDFCVCLILGFLSLLVYNANMRTIASGDTYPARYLPFAILRDHTLYFDKMAGAAVQGRPDAYWITPVKHVHTISVYPVVAPVLVTPLYLPVFLFHGHDWTEQELDHTAVFMEKLAASLVASLSVALFYLLLRRRVDVRTAVLLAVAYAFGTNTWMIGSQALWQHGMGELLLVVCMLLVTGACTSARAFAAGMVLALMTFNRPPDTLFAAALGTYSLRWSGRRGWVVAAGAIVAAAPLLAYNLIVADSVVGAYVLNAGAPFFDYNIVTGFAGLLFSPGRGLFVFTPFLLFLPFGLRHAFRDPRTRLLSILLCITIVIQMLVYAKADWRAGVCWGPRWLTDMLPLLVWLLAPFAAAMRPVSRTAFILAVAASIAIQAVGAFWYTGSSDNAIMAVATNGPGCLDAAWDTANTPFLAELRHPPAPRDFPPPVVAGFIDTIKTGDREVAQAPPGTDISVEGWTLADNHSPAAVEIMLAPATGMISNSAVQPPSALVTGFAPRADVSRTMHTSAPSAWRVVLRDEKLRPGEYLVTVWAETAAGGEFHPVAQRPFTVLPRSPRAASITDEALPGIARDVATRLRGDQQPAGYWLTEYTTSTNYEAPMKEMNTFLTSMLVDILNPVSSDAALDESLTRARAHLAAQIEAGGLVRYHGRPDSPTIPHLGVVITPDTDDTALVWRITGGRENLLPGVLETLKSYRTGEGLYRTWLAPREEFISIDPGTDPNPPDVAIQMHLLMFLAKADPPAAQALYTALRGAIAQDRLWVYYQQTSLVPILRQADLAKAGYPLDLPPARLQTSVPGQQPWLTACRWIAQFETGAVPRPAAAEVTTLLKNLAGDDFAAIRHTPPLVYHNDLSAHVRRFYWSEDFGYALWLRLYLENARAAISQ